MRVDLLHGHAESPIPVRIDFSLGPFYEIGDLVRLVDLDPAWGYVVGKVVDVRKYTNLGLIAYVEFSWSDLIRWSPQTQEKK